MKNLNKFRFICILTVFFVIICSNNILGATITVPSNVSEPSDWHTGMYCAEPGDGLGLVDSNGNLSETTTYEVNELKDVIIEPSTGFAYYVSKATGLNDADMQKVVWSSKQWGNESNVLDKVGHDSDATSKSTSFIQARSYQYGTTYYGLVKEAMEEGKSVLKTTSSRNEIKVFADQIGGTYTVGPYKLGINTESNDYTKEAAQLLYNELIGTNNGSKDEKTTFAKFNGITGINGKEGIFIDKEGKQIVFPNFIPGEEQEFYIRFKPNNDGAIVDTGKPIINFSYITSFKVGTLLKYIPISVQFSNSKEQGNSMTQSLGSSNVVRTEESKGWNDTKFEIDYSKGTTVECNYISTSVSNNDDEIKVRGEFIIKVKSEVEYFGNSKAPFYQLYRVYIEEDVESNSNNINKLTKLKEEEEIKSKFEEKFKNKPYAGSYVGEKIDTSCKVQPNTATIITDNNYGDSWIVTPFNEKLVIERNETETLNENGVVLNNIEYENENSGNDLIDSISTKIKTNNISMNNELGESAGLKSADWVAKEPKYVNHMLRKLKHYGSDTAFGCMIDADLCRITIFHKEGNDWKFLYGWNTFQGVNKKWTDEATGGDYYDSKAEWNGPRSRSFKGAWKVLNPKYIDAYGPNSGMYPTCFVDGGHNSNCANGRCDCQTIEFASGKNPDDYELKNRFRLQGCCGVSQEQAKWVFYNVPVNSTVVVFDKYNPMPKWNEWDNAESLDHKLSEDIEPEKITGGEAISQAAVALACRAEPEKKMIVDWPWRRIYDDRTKAYVDAREKYVKGKNNDGGDYASCDMGVATAVRYSGVDPNMEYKTIPNIWPYLRNSKNWNSVGTLNWDNYSNLRPGDVLINSHHILIYTGNEIVKQKYKNSKADIYEAGFGSYINESYYPSLNMLSWRKGDNEYTIFRHVNSDKKIYELLDGFDYGSYEALTDTYIFDNYGAVSSIQNVVQVPGNTSESSGEENVNENWKNVSIALEGAPINIQLGGRVWLESSEIKTGELSGTLNDGDQNFGGILVSLYELENSGDTTVELIATTTTDKDGKYRFYGQKEKGISLINGLRKYIIMFTYNGQYYQSTYYKNDLTGIYSNAKENGREEFNKRFESIYSDEDNYVSGDKWNKAYAISEKIKNDNGDYIEYTPEGSNEKGVLTFEDIYYQFLVEARLDDAGEPKVEDNKTIWNRKKSYDEILDGSLKNWLQQKGVTKEYEKIKQFIKDTLITATTYERGMSGGMYPIYDTYIVANIDSQSEEYNKDETTKVTIDKEFTNIYSKNSDQSRNINYGTYNRPMNDIAIKKDIYKVSIIVNGKKQDYFYNQKDITNENTWEVKARAEDVLYNGNYTYDREVRKSEYLYDGSDSGTNDIRNMQVFVTYKIVVKNQGKVTTRIDEIVDYYDSDAYEFDGNLQNEEYKVKEYKYGHNEKRKNGQDGESYVNSYLGKDENGTKSGNLTFKNKGIPNNERSPKEIIGENYKYSTLYISGLKSVNGEERFAPEDLGYAYVTFKAKNDEETGKVKIDQSFKDGTLLVGKKNITEINGYSTYYTAGDTIPNDLEGDNKQIDVGGKEAGVIDKDSNPGSINNRDLNNNGDIITDSSKLDLDRQEDDSDKSPNIRIILEKDEKNSRTIKGYVFEDNRDTKSDEAVIGNGVWEEGEKKINGVTLQLVELVQEVDKDGISTGNYYGEKVWGSYTYNGTDKASLDNADKDYSRYYSGKRSSKVIINGPTGTILHLNNDEKLEDGEYSFVSIPAGDFYVRFIYGDTAQTTLTNDSENEVNKLLNNEGIDGLSGLNEKSFNGQDYKSTVYQKALSSNGKIFKEIEQDSEYNSIKGFENYQEQNYYVIDDLVVDSEKDEIYNNPSPNKNNMYYYDVEKSKEFINKSDAKDVYQYRNLSNNWSKGENGQTLLNNRAEILDSFEKLATFKEKDEDGNIKIDEQRKQQEDMIRTLMKNTKMVAQTGIINTEIELNRQETNYGDKLNYIIESVNLGLTERPIAGLKISKEVENFKLENDLTIFDSNKSVQNLFFSEHTKHEVKHNNLGKISSVRLNRNIESRTADLIQGYVDDEILKNATATIKYLIKVENIGEVDYKDEEFYYGGKTKDSSEANISKTDAVQLIDYVSNSVKFDTNEQDTVWKVRGISEIIKYNDSSEEENYNPDTDYTNREYIDRVKSYSTIITTNGLSDALVPKIAKKGTKEKSGNLVLSTKITDNKEDDNLVYNNLTEIIETKNELGRRNKYSIVGNQEMADQNLGKDAEEGAKTKLELIQADEIDTDSSQKIVLMPPTGSKNKKWFIIGLLVIASIVVVLIKIKRNSKS